MCLGCIYFQPLKIEYVVYLVLENTQGDCVANMHGNGFQSVFIYISVQFSVNLVDKIILS